MGLFKKSKNSAQEPAQDAQPDTRPTPPEEGEDDLVSDPIWEPINGISLQDYAELAREAQARGISDETGMIALSRERGWDPADTQAALGGWVQRMGQSMAVGQQFRKYLGY